MRRPLQTRFSFGASTAIMTNLGLVCGLDTSANPKRAIVGSILIIAVADNISDSLGIHVFQESEHVGSREVWLSTFTNYTTRLLVSLTFLGLIVFLPLEMAVHACVVWGLSLLTLLSYLVARDRKEKPLSSIIEHLLIAGTVITASHYVGRFLADKF